MHFGHLALVQKPHGALPKHVTPETGTLRAIWACQVSCSCSHPVPLLVRYGTHQCVVTHALCFTLLCPCTHMLSHCISQAAGIVCQSVFCHILCCSVHRLGLSQPLCLLTYCRSHPLAQPFSNMLSLTHLPTVFTHALTHSPLIPCAHLLAHTPMHKTATL